MKNNMMNKIKTLFENARWKHTFNEEEGTIHTGINMGNFLGQLEILILFDDSLYTVYTILNNRADDHNISKVSEFLHRANFGLKNGNFEIDYEDGEIRYKVSVIYGDIPDEILFESIGIGPILIEKYAKGILKVMLETDTPENCIIECEAEE